MSSQKLRCSNLVVKAMNDEIRDFNNKSGRGSKDIVFFSPDESRKAKMTLWENKKES